MSKKDAVNSATFSRVSVVVFVKLRNFDRFVGKNKKIDFVKERRPIATCGSTQSPAHKFHCLVRQRGIAVLMPIPDPSSNPVTLVNLEMI